MVFLSRLLGWTLTERIPVKDKWKDGSLLAIPAYRLWRSLLAWSPELHRFCTMRNYWEVFPAGHVEVLTFGASLLPISKWHFSLECSSSVPGWDPSVEDLKVGGRGSVVNSGDAGEVRQSSG